MTNMPELIDFLQLPKIGASDHFAILAKPTTFCLSSNNNTKVLVGDMRKSAWRPSGRWMVEKDWSHILATPSREEKQELFFSELQGAIDRGLPLC